jgi:hypothetical protein
VTKGPGDQLADGPAGRGHLRASHADRVQVIGTLKAAFVQGRLTKDEFDERVGQVYVSRTYAELAEITADLPAGLTRTRPPRDPWRATKVAWAAVYAILLPAITAVILVPGHTTAGVVITCFAGSYLFFWLFGVCLMVASRQEKRSAGQLPPRSAPRAAVAERPR